MGKALLVLTRKESDLLQVLRQNSVVEVICPEDLPQVRLDDFQAIAVLGGTEDAGLMLFPEEKRLLDEQIRLGRRVFSEYCLNAGGTQLNEPVSTRYERLVVCDKKRVKLNLAPGLLLDDNSNLRLQVQKAAADGRVLLQYGKNVKGFYQTDLAALADRPIRDRGLWLETPNLLVCSFRISTFLQGRFAPRLKWRSLIGTIVEWLCGGPADLSGLRDVYRMEPYKKELDEEQQIREAVTRGMAWFDRADMYNSRNGRHAGIGDGLGASVYADGSQQLLNRANLRNDCTAETALACFLYRGLSGRDRYRQIADDLSAVCFRDFQVMDGSLYHGMLGWGWPFSLGVCYQDDNARVLIPQLLRCLYTGSRQYLANCEAALDFLVKTTGTDGLRIMRTDGLTEDDIARLSAQPARYPSAHYNAYYLAALLLAHKVTGRPEYRTVAVKGLESLMAVYPDTLREHSETQEFCRLVLPLAYLYWVTGEERHRQWLYRVAGDLQRFRHPSGGYLEWDSGYAARLYDLQGEECSLLAENGNPVVDLLYSVNWLPAAFIQAYFITGDHYFRDLWSDLARFLISIQIHSDKDLIDGAWTRAVDVDAMEVYGVANDIGWAPWSVETGWTMAEICSGLMMGLMEDELMKHYKAGEPE